MGLLTGALQIGRNALLAYQSALQVVGNNISNAGSTSYTRQTPVLSPSTGTVLPEGFTPGGGVTLQSLQRNVDDSLLDRLRLATGRQSQLTTQQQLLGQIEGATHQLSDSSLPNLLQAFFNACSALQNQPNDLASRGVVLTAADTLVQQIQGQRSDVLSLRDQLNSDLKSTAEQANGLGQDIADLNVRITDLESTNRGGANALRDQRDEKLQELGELMEVNVREQPDGSVNVYAGNELLIQGGMYRGITSTQEMVGGEPKVVVQFADNNGPISLGTGKMAGLVAARDENVIDYVSQLNGMARSLINEVNKVHAQGQGLEGFTTVTGTYDVLDTSAALNSSAAGLDLVPRNGSFLITVTDTSGNPPSSQTTTIPVDLDGVGTDESLDSLAAKINASVANVTATVTADNRLQLTAANGFKMSFSEDSSNALAALGVNTFFTGRDAQDIAVNPVLTSNPNMLAAATSSAPGDGSNAAQLAALATTPLEGLNGRSLMDFYNGAASDVAVKSAAAKTGADAADGIRSSLQSQRESISGVSLDEETISLMSLERAYQGAARYTSVVDQMVQEMLQLVPYA